MTIAVEAAALLHVRNGFYRPAVPHLRQVGSQGGFSLQKSNLGVLRLCESVSVFSIRPWWRVCRARARAPLRGRRRHDYTCTYMYIHSYIHIHVQDIRASPKLQEVRFTTSIFLNLCSVTFPLTKHLFLPCTKPAVPSFQMYLLSKR